VVPSNRAMKHTCTCCTPCTGLRSAGLKITSEGEILAEEIDKRQLIDKHYYAIASKATLLTPDQLNVPEAQFEKQFGEMRSCRTRVL
jgi:hypothetical protein